MLRGSYVTLAPLSVREHAGALWESVGGASHTALWDYMPDGPWPEREAFVDSIGRKEASSDPYYWALLDGASGRPVGHASFLRIEPRHRVIEVGSIMYGSEFQRTRGATEAMYLMARYAFEELGYRRYEWKCDALNQPSRDAALRLGFRFEGIFRQHMIVKGRNRDTAWFSLLDSEWPERKAALERWLDASNFGPDGKQRTSLRRVQAA
jgi:RimJ/RimL family protein N-acetyltransferase